MSLCNTCSTLPLTVAHLRSTAVPFHTSLACLKESADMRCPFCSLCWTALQRESDVANINKQLNSENPEQMQLYGSFEDHGNMRSFRKSSMGSHILVSCGEPADIRSYLKAVDTSIYAHLNVHVDSDAPAKGRLHGRFCAAEPYPYDSQLSLSRSWLTECLTYHESCRRRSSTFWPLRVLHVGDGKQQLPRLIVGEQLSEPYAALSYCWGSSTHGRLRLLERNLEEFQGGINVDGMARTNREALEVVRQLGIKYLWIDALCIIQDSKDDWQQQSQLMAQIYDGAHLTLVAGSAADSSDGFVRTTEPGDRVEIPYSHPTDPELSGNVYTSLQRSRNEGPVKTRAWCFQERTLSNRMLVWGAEQIYFRCLEGTIYEDGAGDVESLSVGLGNSQTELSIEATLEVRGQHSAAALRQWYSLVQQYSSRELWDPADVFAALSGIALQVERSLECEYLAGIWDRDMIRGLLWQPRNLLVSNLFKPLVRPVITNPQWGGKTGDPLVRAPSWSWAAPQGPVTYGSCFMARYDTIFLDSSRRRIRPADPRGRWSPREATFHPADFDMSECTIRIIGKPSAVLCSKSSPVDTAAHGTSSLFRRAIKQKRHVLLTAKDGPRAGDAVGIGLYDIVEEEEKETWCLQVIDQRGIKARHTIDGLLLRRCATATFARIGTFRILDDRFFDDEQLADETFTLI